MPTPKQIEDQVNKRIRRLVEFGLADDQLFAFQRGDGKRVEITFPTAGHISTALRNIDYADMYRVFVQERVYNARMLDGALVQMLYEFSDGVIQRHRLAFLPAPHLDEFQNTPDTYLDDELHGDVVARRVVPFPLRYDYDARAGRHRELHHPRSHLTLGQYEQCRIPVTAPVTPHWFVDFVLRNFYHTSSRRYADEMPSSGGWRFDESITAAERRLVHMTVPIRGASI